MKVLWITNTIFPDACNVLGLKIPTVGGWMYAGAVELLENISTLELAVATLYDGLELKIINVSGIRYYLIPGAGKKRQYNKELEGYWRKVEKDFVPEVIHIHGSEYPHGFAYLKANGNKGVVVSIQGLVSVCERYYYGTLSERDIFFNITLRDIIRRDTLFSQKKSMILRGRLENQMINAVAHVIGRTTWDKAQLWSINSNVNYHIGNETLRKVFYENKWSIDECEKNSIFLSQAHYPIKGLMQMLDAFVIILKHYPSAKIYVSGEDFFNGNQFKLTGYGKIIRSMIKKHNLHENIIFTGMLNEVAMCERFLKSNVFICPSSIENSSNSIGEAQLLGVPCIGSYVGGTADLIEHRKTGLLYRFEEIEMLAFSICEIFSNITLAKQLSENSRVVALHRHNAKVNANQLFQTYKRVCKEPSH